MKTCNFILYPVLAAALFSLFGCGVSRRVEQRQTAVSLSHPASEGRTQRPQHRSKPLRHGDPDTLGIVQTDTLADGQRVAALRIEQVTVVSRMRTVAERDGKVRLDFVVTLPEALLGRSRSVVVTPVLHRSGERIALEDLVIRGGRFSLLQQRDYWQYEKYRWVYDPDSTAAERMFNRLVKFPYPEDARLDSIVTQRGMISYHYSEEIAAAETSKRMYVTLQGKVVGIDDSACALPSSDTLTYLVSSMLSFVDTLPRYRIEIVDKYVSVTDRIRVRFPVGSAEVADTLGDNRTQLGRLTRRMREVLEQREFYVDAVTLAAASSPDGPALLNEGLAERRARALKSYLARRFGQQVDTLLTVRRIGEDWATLAELIRSRKEVRHREEILTLIASENDPDRREALLRGRYPEAFAWIRENLYPALRAVVVRYDLRRVGMVKDTVHTTVLDSAYMRGVRLLQERRYDEALRVLGRYGDRNTVVALLSLGRNGQAEELLKRLPEDAVTEYLRAVVCMRLGRRAEGRRHYDEACRREPRMVYRGNLDPEINELFKE